MVVHSLSVVVPLKCTHGRTSVDSYYWQFPHSTWPKTNVVLAFPLNGRLAVLNLIVRWLQDHTQFSVQFLSHLLVPKLWVVHSSFSHIPTAQCSAVRPRLIFVCFHLYNELLKRKQFTKIHRIIFLTNQLFSIKLLLTDCAGLRKR